MYRRKLEVDMASGTMGDILTPSRSGTCHTPLMRKRSLVFVIGSLAVAVFFWRVTRAMPHIFPRDDLRVLHQTLHRQSDEYHLDASTTTLARNHPRQLRYEMESNTVHRIEMLPAEPLDLPHPLEKSNITNNDNNNGDEEDDNDDDGYDDECHVVNRQHQRIFPTCNRAHEIDGNQLSFINCGGSRCAFSFPDDYDYDDESVDERRRVVLKLPKFKKDIQRSRMEAARQDGLIMEQATASPYIANVFGVCGAAQVVEYSDKGTLHDLVKIARLQKRDTMKPIDKLKIAIHIASAVTDLHDPSLVAATHGDLCMNQYLLVDGIYKLNDFHLSAFVREDANHQTCLDSTNFAPDCASVHAPEEKDWNEVDLQKSDVYMMGNVLYYLYTKNFLYEGIPDKAALEMLYNGKRTPFPEDLDTTVAGNSALQSAIRKCWTHYPDHRPLAREIRDSLLKEFSAIEGRSVSPGDEVLKVKLPPLPKDHRYTGSSFDTVNDNVKKHAPLRIQYNNES